MNDHMQILFAKEKFILHTKSPLRKLNTKDTFGLYDI